MGLFDKKYCSICGEKIGLLGNRKLADGNLCKECANKLSPRFTERRESTVEEIRAQLEYRAANKEKLGSFRVTNTYGTGSEKLYLDAEAGAFVVSSSAPDKGNPDIVTFDMVTGCEADIRESKSEVKYRSADGRTCSYSPAQYTKKYDFYMLISVNHPYFDQIRFSLNGSSLTFEPQFTVIRDPNQNLLKDTGDAKNKPALVPPTVFARPAGDPAADAGYQRYLAMADEIRAKLLRLPESEPEPAKAEEAPSPASVVCPYCGEANAPGDTCAFCGAPLA